MKTSRNSSPTQACGNHSGFLFAATTMLLSPIVLLMEFIINIPVMNAVWRERRELEFLTDAHIKDIGLSSDNVRHESQRSFFDIPENRKRSIRSHKSTTYSMTC